MSFLNADQYASVTTRLLDVMDTVMPRRHQIVAAAIVTFIALSAIASAITNRPAPRPALVGQPAPIVVIATATAGRGLAKHAAPMVFRAAPTAAPAPTVPTAAPLPAVEQVQVVVQSARRVGERRSDKAPPR